jgi:hypothetical protein
MLSIPWTCIRFLRIILTTVFSSSLALTSEREIATVISGISISGISDTGNRVEATKPSISNAMKVMMTAIGREIRNLVILTNFCEEQRAQGEGQRAQGEGRRAKGKELRAKGKELRVQSEGQRAQSEEQRARSEGQRAEGKGRGAKVQGKGQRAKGGERRRAQGEGLRVGNQLSGLPRVV